MFMGLGGSVLPMRTEGPPRAAAAGGAKAGPAFGARAKRIATSVASVLSGPLQGALDYACRPAGGDPAAAVSAARALATAMDRTHELLMLAGTGDREGEERSSASALVLQQLGPRMVELYERLLQNEVELQARRITLCQQQRGSSSSSSSMAAAAAASAVPVPSPTAAAAEGADGTCNQQMCQRLSTMLTQCIVRAATTSPLPEAHLLAQEATQRFVRSDILRHSARLAATLQRWFDPGAAAPADEKGTGGGGGPGAGGGSGADTGGGGAGAAVGPLRAGSSVFAPTGYLKRGAGSSGSGGSSSAQLSPEEWDRNMARVGAELYGLCLRPVCLYKMAIAVLDKQPQPRQTDRDTFIFSSSSTLQLQQQLREALAAELAASRLFEHCTDLAVSLLQAAEAEARRRSLVGSAATADAAAAAAAAGSRAAKGIEQGVQLSRELDTCLGNVDKALIVMLRNIPLCYAGRQQGQRQVAGGGGGSSSSSSHDNAAQQQEEQQRQPAPAVPAAGVGPRLQWLVLAQAARTLEAMGYGGGGRDLFGVPYEKVGPALPLLGHSDRGDGSAIEGDLRVYSDIQPDMNLSITAHMALVELVEWAATTAAAAAGDRGGVSGGGAGGSSSSAGSGEVAACCWPLIAPRAAVYELCMRMAGLAAAAAAAGAAHAKESAARQSGSGGGGGGGGGKKRKGKGKGKGSTAGGSGASAPPADPQADVLDPWHRAVPTLTSASGSSSSSSSGRSFAQGWVTLQEDMAPGVCLRALLAASQVAELQHDGDEHLQQLPQLPQLPQQQQQQRQDWWGCVAEALRLPGLVGSYKVAIQQGPGIMLQGEATSQDWSRSLSDVVCSLLRLHLRPGGLPPPPAVPAPPPMPPSSAAAAATLDAAAPAPAPGPSASPVASTAAAEPLLMPSQPPPPDVEAALSAGLLRAAESAMRRSTKVVDRGAAMSRTALAFLGHMHMLTPGAGEGEQAARSLRIDLATGLLGHGVCLGGDDSGGGGGGANGGGVTGNDGGNSFPLLWAMRPDAVQQQLQLLAFGPLPQSAALVATLGKLVKWNLEPQQMQRSLGAAMCDDRRKVLGDMRGESLAEVMVLTELLSSCCQTWPPALAHLIRQHSGGGGAAATDAAAAAAAAAGGGGVPPPLQRLRRVASFALQRWLPALMRTSLQSCSMPVGVVGSVIARRACLGTLHAAHPLLCSWLAFRQQQQQASSTSNISSSQPAATAATAAAYQERSWRQLFVYDAPLTELLANAVDLVLDDPRLDGCRRPAEILATLRQLHADICTAFLKLAPLAAALLPGALRGAMLEADEAAAAWAAQRRVAGRSRRGGGAGSASRAGAEEEDADEEDEDAGYGTGAERRALALSQRRLSRFFALAVLRASAPAAADAGLWQRVQYALERLRSSGSGGGGGGAVDGMPVQAALAAVLGARGQREMLSMCGVLESPAELEEPVPMNATAVAAAEAEAATAAAPAPAPAGPLDESSNVEGSREVSDAATSGAAAAVGAEAALLPALFACGNPVCSRLDGESEMEGAAAALQVCGGCRGVRYCCRDCQAEHWKHGGHKEACKAKLDMGV